MLEVRVEDPTDLRSLGARWERFAANVPCSFFQSWAWVGCLAEERFNRPVLISAFRGATQVAMALFNRGPTWRHTLWLAETGDAEWDALFIEHNGVLLAPGDDAALQACLAAALDRGVVVLSGISAEQWAAAPPGATISAQTRTAPFVRLSNDTRQSLSHISANTRYQLRRSARRYHALGPLQLTRAASAPEAQAFLQELALLHQRHWTARHRPGAFANARFVRFHHALIERTAAATDGTVDLLQVTAGAHVVGYLQNFRFRGHVYAYQSGFNYAEAPTHAKPGLTCHEHAIAHYAAEGMTVYDFLAGDDRYKLSLATGQTPMHWVTLAPRRSLAALTAQVRRMLRRIMLAALCAGVATGAHAADIPQPHSPEQVVGVVVENTANAAMPPRIFSFGQVFRQGQVPSARAVSASSEGQAIPIQVDVMARYPDGSARIGVVTLRSPALSAHQALPVMLSLAGAANVASTDITTPAEAENLTIDLTLHSAAQPTAYHIDAHAQAAPDRFWRQGNLANERRLDLPIAGALHVVLDITRYADGTRFTDVQFRNDVAMGQVGGTQIYDVRISLGSKTVFHDSVRQHFQYQSWHVPVWSSSPPSVNVQHDIAALEQSGMVPAFDVRTRVSPKILAEQARLMATPGWGAPLAANGVAQYMATTGARGDIGPTTRANAIWLITQSPEAAAFALGQADAAGAIPWQFWNARAGTWLNTAAYPDIWVDGRGGPASYTTGLTQPVDPATGWATDTAHQPDLAYIAYLMTGQRRYLDLLNAQAAYSITATWPDKQARNRAEGNVIRGNQLRAAAWSLRQIDEAAWANPPGSAEARYFASIADANWRWLVAQLPAWTRQEGATAGYILGAAYGEAGVMPPWQQDYFVSTAVAAAEQGNADALTYLRWSENFIAGRFLAAAAGFRPHNGISYLLGNICGGAICQSWAALQGATEKAGQDNGAGWAHSDGDYGALALASLAGLITVTHAPRAQEAYRYLLGAGAPHTGVADQQTDVQLNIVPLD